MKYRTAPGVILAEICSRSFLVTPEATIQVNETAASCWKNLTQGADEKELCEDIQDQYETEDIEVLRSDIRDLIRSLRERRLIERYSH